MVHYFIYAQKGADIRYFYGMSQEGTPRFFALDDPESAGIKLWSTSSKGNATEAKGELEDYFQGKKMDMAVRIEEI